MDYIDQLGNRQHQNNLSLLNVSEQLDDNLVMNTFLVRLRPRVESKTEGKKTSKAHTALALSMRMRVSPAPFNSKCITFRRKYWSQELRGKVDKIILMTPPVTESPRIFRHNYGGNGRRFGCWENNYTNWILKPNSDHLQLCKCKTVRKQWTKPQHRRPCWSSSRNTRLFHKSTRKMKKLLKGQKWVKVKG